MQTTTNTAQRLVIYIFLFFVAWTIRATVLFPIDQSISSPEWRQVYADVLRVLLWVVPAVAYIALVDKKRPVEYLRLNTLGRKKAVLQLSIIVLLYFGLILFISFAQAGFPSRITFSPFLLSNSWLKTLLVILVGPVSEEILYRGFFLQKIQTLTGNWTANLMTSLLFVGIHLPNWIYTGEVPLEILSMSLSIFVLSLLLGSLMQKTDSLWPSILVHILNNMISFYISFG